MENAREEKVSLWAVHGARSSQAPGKQEYWDREYGLGERGIH